jgi:hypothetical protein
VSPAHAALLVMSIVAPIAAIDGLYFHIYKLRLYARPASQCETVTHLLRGALFATGAFLLARYEPRGAWFWVVTAVIALDFANNIADVILEPKSRAALGGLPPVEYVIHIIGATASGGIAALWIAIGHPLAALPTELAPQTTLPGWLGTNGYVLAAGAVAMTIAEGALLARAMARQRLLAV